MGNSSSAGEAMQPPPTPSAAVAGGAGSAASTQDPAAAAAAAAVTGVCEGTGGAAGACGRDADTRQGTVVPAFPVPGGPEVQLQRLSQIFFMGQPRPTNEDSDAPPMLQRRHQRHKELTDKEVKAAVVAVANEIKTGMPMPAKDGTLKPPETWAGIWKDKSTWPGAYVRLEDSDTRAMRCKGDKEWTEESKEFARMHHLVTGTVVFVMPEVSFSKKM